MRRRLFVAAIVAALSLPAQTGPAQAAEPTVTEYADRIVFVDPAPAALCDELRAKGKAKPGPCVITTTVGKLNLRGSDLVGLTASIDLATTICSWGCPTSPYVYPARSYISSQGPFGMWTIWTNYTVKLNGYYIYHLWSDFQFTAGIFQIRETWTGAWNNGGRNLAPYISIGSNWVQTYLVVSSSKGHRINIRPNGNIHSTERW